MVTGPVLCGCGRRVPDRVLLAALWRCRGVVCTDCGARCGSKALVRLISSRVAFAHW